MPVTKILDIGETLPSAERRLCYLREDAGMTLERLP
jgi:hypothetical protein